MKYLVKASYRVYLETVVEAENKHDAQMKGEEIAMNGEMTEIEPFDTDFSIDGVEEVKE